MPVHNVPQSHEYGFIIDRENCACRNIRPEQPQGGEAIGRFAGQPRSPHIHFAGHFAPIRSLHFYIEDIRMPSLIHTTVLFLTVSFCSARCTHSHAKSTAQSLSTVSSAIHSASTSLTASSTELPIVSSAVDARPAPTSTQSVTSPNLIEHFKPGAKWQIAIQDPVDPRGGLQPADAKVVDVDLFLASKDPTLIPTLHVSYGFAVK